MRALENLYATIVEEVTAEVERRVMEQIHTTDIPDHVLNSKEAAEYLNVSIKTLYTLCTEKQIRHIPAGSRQSKKPALLFRQSTLDAWLREREAASVS